MASAAGEYHAAMRIVCPSCTAAYEVPEARLLPGQSVRCARCGTNWTPVAGPQPAAAPQPLAAPPLPQPLPTPSGAQIFSASNPFAGTERPGARFASGPAVLAGWVVSIAAVVGLCWAAVTWRYDIMHAWPPSERLYSTLGLMAGR